MNEDIRKMINMIKNVNKLNENKELEKLYGSDILNKKVTEYVDFIKSHAVNNKLKIYRGLSNVKNVLSGNNTFEFTNAYTLKLEVAEAYGETIVSGEIYLNDVDWKWVVERLLQKIEDYISFGEVDDINKPFSEIDFEFEVTPISDDKVMNKKISN